MNGGEVWRTNDAILKSLEDFQSYMMRCLLQVPKSCPLPSLTYESNLLQMKYRLFSRIVNFTKHILLQDEETNLSKQIINQQISYDWPGSYKQAQLI